jgi:hypothetical protein
MTVEELRGQLVSGIDGILEAPWIISRLLTPEHRRLLRAQRAYWQGDDGSQLQKLLDLFDKERAHADDVQETK